jgi:hypothetical protein
VVDQLCAATDQRLTRADDRQMSLGECSPRCLSGYSSFGSTRARRARFSASISSVLRKVCVDEPYLLRGLATKTSWPHSSSSSTLLTHGEWVPASMAMRSGGCCSEQKRRLRASGVVVRSLPSSITSPLSVSTKHRDNCSGLPDPPRLLSSVFLCYHHPWADPPSFGPLRRARI